MKLLPRKHLKKAYLIVSLFSIFIMPCLSILTAAPTHAGSVCNGPILYGRQQCTGFFTGTDVRVNGYIDGDSVINNNGNSLWGIQNVDDFVNLMRFLVNGGGSSNDTTGAAFLIDTMLGKWGWDFGTIPNGINYARANFGDWESRVRYYDAKGWANWNQTISFTAPFQNSLMSFWRENDDIFYMKQQDETRPVIVFYNPDGSRYEIKKNCGNFVGDPIGLWSPPRFGITGRTTVSQATATPGSQVTFSSYLSNSGPDYASGITWHERDPSNGAIIQQGTNDVGAGSEINVSNEFFTIPGNAAFGSTYCRYIDFAPATNGVGFGSGLPACVQVVAQYSLIPTVSSSSPTAQQNDTITFTYSVQNSGPTRSQTTNCNVVGNTRASGYTPLPQQDVARTSDPGYVPPPTACPVDFNPGASPVATEAVNIGSLAPGQQVCRSLVVDPKDQNGGPRTSAESCVVIAKTPYAHFLGNDIWAGGGFAGVGNPPCNSPGKIQTVVPHQLQDGSVAGSLTEYGAFALGDITNFGSASKALFDPFGRNLTFANTYSDRSLGKYNAPQHCINNYISTYNTTPVDALPLPGAVDVGAQSSGVWHLSGNRSLSGNVPAGAEQVYLVDGDVTITGDITYPANYNGANDIPSIVIISKRSINVLDTVGQIDGIFTTSGTFHTCNQHTGTLTVSTCNKQLNINGAVIANQLNLRRTFGADGNDDTARKQPAERFNFNAEMYIRDVLNGSTASPVIRTIEQKDLPPRY